MRLDTTSFTRFQRILLGTDGTVTHLLEAYADEPIEVVKLVEEFSTAGDAHPDLELAGNDEVLCRQVVLRGRHSRSNLLYAEAAVALRRVEPAFLDALVGTDKPIGVLLAESRTETFREILRVTREPAGPSGFHFGLDPGSDIVSRTYRIVSGGLPMILITEKFPSDSFLGITG